MNIDNAQRETAPAMRWQQPPRRQKAVSAGRKRLVARARPAQLLRVAGSRLRLRTTSLYGQPGQQVGRHLARNHLQRLAVLVADPARNENAPTETGASRSFAELRKSVPAAAVPSQAGDASDE
jgi:hypothetical protein